MDTARTRSALVWLGALLLGTSVQSAPDTSDPFRWLEQVDGARAMAWVKSENARTLSTLESDPRYAGLHEQALRIAEATDRIPMPHFLDGQLYNFWQDAQHVRGIWRMTTLEDYRHDAPSWKTVLDLDELSQREHANWVWKGARCLRPEETRCLLSLSDGGEDAVSIREFDLTRGGFVDDGFVLPKSKQNVAWVSADQLLVARDWGAGTLTQSSYPFVVKSLRRGEPLANARELFRGKPSDVEVNVAALEDGAGNRGVFILRALNFFQVEAYLVQDDAVKQLNLPLKSELQDLVAGRLLVKLNEDWNTHAQHFPAGALVSLDWKATQSDPQHLHPRLVYAPEARESLGDVASTHSNLLISIYDNVRGRAYLYAPTSDGGWSRRALELPDNASIDVVSADSRSENAFLSVAGFLQPSSLWLADTAGTALDKVKQLPARFDATPFIVEQFEATSTDGTQVPYFVVHRRDFRLDGSNPTLMTAYGGFQVSYTPFYSGNIGKLWLERGGVFVLANIRGGGEFGPAWHEAGLKTHRQRIYDDFAAVGRDLIARKITQPRRLGIEGGSNGGLLMGVEYTQHPELWNAVDMQVPLLDMLRYETIAAGTSWVGEYGSVSQPDERAFLASISPYANLHRGVHYPRPLVWTTTKDDRVGPQHARKFAARLAAMGIPYLFYEVIEGGHGSGANLKEQAHTLALEMTYFTQQLMD